LAFFWTKMTGGGEGLDLWWGPPLRVSKKGSILKKSTHVLRHLRVKKRPPPPSLFSRALLHCSFASWCFPVADTCKFCAEAYTFCKTYQKLIENQRFWASTRPIWVALGVPRGALEWPRGAQREGMKL
jgi:hypothetical protein